MRTVYERENGSRRAERLLKDRRMKSSRDPRIDAYIAKAAPFAQPILQHLREIVHRGCPDAEESIKWGMPSFGHAGKILCHMAAFKAHCAFGFWHQGMEAVVKRAKAAAEPAMGGFGRITAPSDLPDDKTLLGYVKAAAKLNESDEPGRARPTKKAKTLPVPADLAAALKKNKTAAKTFGEFSPSHRKEYIEWITEAKREETRQKRLATTLDWLAEGKSRHWKHERC